MSVETIVNDVETRADVVVDPERRVVELNYAPVSGD